MEVFILHRLDQLLSKIEALNQRVSMLEGRRQIPMALFERRVGALETRIGNLEADTTVAQVLEQVQDNILFPSFVWPLCLAARAACMVLCGASCAWDRNWILASRGQRTTKCFCYNGRKLAVPIVILTNRAELNVIVVLNNRAELNVIVWLSQKHFSKTLVFWVVFDVTETKIPPIKALMF